MKGFSEKLADNIAEILYARGGEKPVHQFDVDRILNRIAFKMALDAVIAFEDEQRKINDRAKG